MMQTIKHNSRKRITNWLLKLRGNEYALDRAKLLIDKGRQNEAIQFLDVSNEVFQNSSELKAEAAKFLFDVGDNAVALEWLRRGGIKKIDKNTAFQWEAELEKQNEHSLAVELLNLFAESGFHPDQHDPSETHFRIARLKRILGDTEAAIEHTIRCLESGNYPNVLSMLSGIHCDVEKRQLLDGVDRLKYAAEKPGSFEDRLYIAISDIYRLNGDYQNSAVYMGKARDKFQWNGQVMTEAKPKQPNFLIIGTMKSGTTGFYHTLCQHRQVFQSIRKEVRYFSDPNATHEWYQAHFPRLPEGDRGITGEATPNYFCGNTHDRIAKTLPDVKLICLMRDPAMRAVSHFYHGVRHGLINCPMDQFFSFERLEHLTKKPDSALESFVYGDSTNGGKMFHPLVYGLYPYFLRRWFRKFDSSKILLLTLEEFSKNQDETIAKTCDFLGIDQPGPLQLTKPYTGIYDANDESIQEVLPRLNEFYKESNRILFEEFGIQFGTST